MYYSSSHGRDFACPKCFLTRHLSHSEGPSGNQQPCGENSCFIDDLAMVLSPGARKEQFTRFCDILVLPSGTVENAKTPLESFLGVYDFTL